MKNGNMQSTNGYQGYTANGKALWYVQGVIVHVLLHGQKPEVDQNLSRIEFAVRCCHIGLAKYGIYKYPGLVVT